MSVVFALKAYLTAITPLSLEFTYAVMEALFGHTYYSRAPYSYLLRGLYQTWLALPIEHPALKSVWRADFFHPSFSAYILVFLLKSPLLLLDLATVLALYLALKHMRPDRARAGLVAWTLNPYLVLMNEMWAPVDLLPTFFMFVGLLLVALGKRKTIAMLSVGLSIALKLFPLMAIPGIVATSRRRVAYLAAVLTSAIGIAIYFIWVSNAGYNPLLGMQTYDIFTQYFGFEFTIKTLEHAPPGFGFGQDVVGIATVAVVIMAVLVLEKWPHDSEYALDAALLLLLTYLALSNFWPQYLLWVLPLLTIDFALRKRPITYLITLCASALVLDLTVFHSYFTANSAAFFFVPADSEPLKAVVMGFEQFATDDLVVALIQPLTRLVFTVTSFAYAYHIIEDRTKLFSAIFGDLHLSDRFRTYLKSKLASLGGNRRRLGRKVLPPSCSTSISDTNVPQSGEATRI